MFGLGGPGGGLGGFQVGSNSSGKPLLRLPRRKPPQPPPGPPKPNITLQQGTTTILLFLIIFLLKSCLTFFLIFGIWASEFQFC